MKQISANIFLGYLTIILLAGCATGYWVTLKNGHPADTAEMRMDSLKCEREAAQTYPYAQVINSSGGGASGSSNTTCYGSGSYVNCNTSGGGYTAPRITTSDGNARRRSDYYDSCMAAFGYERIFVSDEANRNRTSSSRTYVDNPGVMECERNSDCGQGRRCRSKKGGGTECR